ncbi:hypothetical protein MJ122_27715 [Pseudomonas sp. DP-17]|nr:hypothetical protein [Pseudomonas sp. DP-17]
MNIGPRTPELVEISPQLSATLMRLVEQIALESDPIQVHVQTGIVQGYYDALLAVGMLSVYNHRTLRNTAAKRRDYRLGQLKSTDSLAATEPGEGRTRLPALTIVLPPHARELLMEFRAAVASQVRVGRGEGDSTADRESMLERAVALAFEVEQAAVTAEQNEPVKSA